MEERTLNTVEIEEHCSIPVDFNCNHNNSVIYNDDKLYFNKQEVVAMPYQEKSTQYLAGPADFAITQEDGGKIKIVYDGMVDDSIGFISRLLEILDDIRLGRVFKEVDLYLKNSQMIVGDKDLIVKTLMNVYKEDYIYQTPDAIRLILKV